MPVERKEPDRIRLMDAFLKETQAFAITLRLGVISREEWRAWLRQEYNVPLAPPITIAEVPDMRDIEGMPEFVAALVDGRIEELFTAEEVTQQEADEIIEQEMGQNGSQQSGDEEPTEVFDTLTDENLQRLAEEDR